MKDITFEAQLIAAKPKNNQISKFVRGTMNTIKSTNVNKQPGLVGWILKLRRRALTLLALLGLLLVGGTVYAVTLFLAPYEPNQPPRADDGAATQQGINKVISANNEFAFDLYSELGKSKKGNLFYSPFSISAALAMTYEGAKGKTADEMKSVFHFPDALGPNFAAVYNHINNGAKDYELRTGNALWTQQDFPFLTDYKNRIEKYYGGKAADLDFVGQTERSRQTINSFIEEQTNDKIKDLISKGLLNETTRLVLTNAIYFKGTWRWEFDAANTYDADFKTTPASAVKTPMMNMRPNKDTRFKYVDTGDMQILELPYKGDEISMLIMLPREGLYALEPTFTSEKLNEYKSIMEETKLDSISLPKFEFDTKYSLADTLRAMGMPTAFSEDRADFSGMTGRKDLFISFVVHQAYVKVDEKGTEAAAATAVGASVTSAGPPTLDFRADHPFIFLIQDNKTGDILFVGRVADPTK